ncbi:MAG: histidine kinase [Schlesneria sp.]|nr:histidine kinase [Schlesneria sp.]
MTGPVARLLIVEDLKEDAVLLNRAVQRHGFSTEWEQVQTLEELAAALDRQPDVVLADYCLPSLTLEDILTQVRRHPHPLPVIVVSGVIGEEIAAETIRMGAVDYVMKDRLQRLGPAVERALNEARHRRREQELEAELQLRNMAFASIADGVVIIDARSAEHPIDDCNPAFEKMFGYRRDELIGKSFFFMADPGTDHLAIAQMRQAIVSFAAFMGDVDYRRRDGSQIYTNVKIQPFCDDSGNMTRFVAVFRDVTDQREAAAREARHVVALAHFERLKSVGEMASGLAHELNQPLTALVVQSETAATLASHMRGSNKDLLQVALEAITSQATRAGAIIEGLRRMVKKSDPSRSTIHIEDVVRDTLRIMDHEFRQNQVQVVVREQCGLPTILADRIQIQQVIINLIRNAVEAMDETAPELRKVEISCDQVGRDNRSYVVVSVSDHGRGIPPDQMARLFEKFYTTKQNGIGLGLAICRSIVEYHEGSIECRRNADVGVTFMFSLVASGE